MAATVGPLGGLKGATRATLHAGRGFRGLLQRIVNDHHTSSADIGCDRGCNDRGGDGDDVMGDTVGCTSACPGCDDDRVADDVDRVRGDRVLTGCGDRVLTGRVTTSGHVRVDDVGRLLNRRFF
jgi:hypothetical protein